LLLKIKPCEEYIFDVIIHNSNSIHILYKMTRPPCKTDQDDEWEYNTSEEEAQRLGAKIKNVVS